MLKIWDLKKQQQEASAGPKVQKMAAGEIRLRKDISDLEQFETMKADWANPEDPMHFTLTITPDEGMYQGGAFKFSFDVSRDQYPHKQPKVLCTQKIYHPNIDLQGNVCLNILREDWKPVLNLNSIFVGLQYLFLEPNADDPLNKDAAEVLRRNRELFTRNVKASMAGRTVDSVQYENVLISQS